MAFVLDGPSITHGIQLAVAPVFLLTAVSGMIGAVAGYALLFAIGFLGRKAFGREAMGGGDVKMMAMVGAFTGVWGMFLTLMFGPMGWLLYMLVRTRYPQRPT